MPTPFMHLQIAEQLLAHPDLDAAVRAQLQGHWSAFYLGSVAADVQTVTHAPRASTHFYKMARPTDRPAYDVMLTEFPQLAAADCLTPAQAVFVAAYRAHLLADLRWYWDIAGPFFVEPTDWPADLHERFLVHNILLTYLDGEALTALPAGAGATLAAAAPAGWLPFVSDADLCQWRDLLEAQLQPGAPVSTVAIYAQRMQMDPADFAAHLADASWMARRVFSRVSLTAVRRSAGRVLGDSVRLVNEFLQPNGADP